MANELHRRYPSLVSTPRRARLHLAAYLDDHSRPELTATAILLVAELVTNAVVHGAGTVELRARFVGPTLYVEVVDGSDHLPQLRGRLVRGHGLDIVDALALSWGVTPLDGHGKATWFYLQEE
jgi:anti-sigma regulatory factor (Ser/Thr protein kinase)